jgi:undecaprenyl-diphosphatase
MGLNSESAANYSFLVSIPIMLGVLLKTVLKDADYIIPNALPLLLANLIAFISGLIALRLLLNYLKKPRSLRTFGWYRVILAAIVLIAVLL